MLPVWVVICIAVAAYMVGMIVACMIAANGQRDREDYIAELHSRLALAERAARHK